MERWQLNISPWRPRAQMLFTRGTIGR